MKMKAPAVSCIDSRFRQGHGDRLQLAGLVRVDDVTDVSRSTDILAWFTTGLEGVVGRQF